MRNFAKLAKNQKLSRIVGVANGESILKRVDPYLSVILLFRIGSCYGQKQRYLMQGYSVDPIDYCTT